MELKRGEQLEVGDIIEERHTLGLSKWSVVRVTAKYAFVKYNDVAEGKYPRVFNYGFQPLPREKYNMTSYKIIRP